MKLVVDGGVTVTLSRRNLLTLLYKLDDPDSQRTIVKFTDHGLCIVRAEPDDEHYGERAYGRMEEGAEAFIESYGKDAA